MLWIGIRRLFFMRIHKLGITIIRHKVTKLIEQLESELMKEKKNFREKDFVDKDS